MPADVPTDRRLSPVAAWLVALAATSTMAVSYVDRQALSVLAPTITDELQLDETAFGWLGSAFAFAYLLGAPAAGILVDRLGARKALILSVLVWSIVAATHSLAIGLWSLLVLRVLLGAAESPSFPGAAQTVARVLPPTSREAGFGILFTGSSIGAAIAAVLLPKLEHAHGWRIALLLTAIIGLSWIPMWWLATASPRVQAAMAVPQDEPRANVPWIEVARNPAVLRAVAAILASAPVTGFVLQWGAKVLVAQHGVLQENVGHYLWLPPILFDLGAIGFGVAATVRTRWTGGGTSHRALFVVALSLMLLIGGLGYGQTAWQTTICAGVAIAGGGGVYTLCTADMFSRVERSAVARAGGIGAAAQSLTLIVCLPLIGAVVDRTHSYLAIGLGLMAWGLPGTLVWLMYEPPNARESIDRAPERR